MGTAEGKAAEQPLLQPRVIRFLKQRSKLVDLGFREEVLEQLEAQIVERRTPSRVAEKAADETMNRARESTTPVVRDRVRERMEQANESMLDGL